MKNPIQELAEYKKKRSERPKQYVLPYGEQDPMDVISYASVEEQKNYLVMGDRYIRTLFISGYPYEAELNWLDSLINFNHNADISFHIEQVDGNEALRKLKRKITELESTRQSKLKTNSFVGPDVEDPLVSAKELFAAIKRGQEKLFQVSIYVAITSESLEGLEDVTKMLMSTLSARLFYVKPAAYQQLEGLQSILPRGENALAQKRNLNSSTTALAFPFMSSELVQEGGILYGVNQSNKSLVILDRYKLQNANSIMFATSGAGKSYTTKVEILRQLTQGTKVIVIDPEREYERLTEQVGGTYIRLSAKSEQKINPFDTSSTARGKEDIAEHIQDLTEVISLMVGGLDEEEKAAVDKAIIAIYEEATSKPPLLADFYTKLHDLGQHKLCLRLEKYTKGSLTDILDSHTNIELENRLVVFDIKDLSESLRPVMMMIIANFVQNKVKSNPEKRLLVIDEGWLLLEHEQSARFVAGLTRRARKYYLAVAVISQQVSDFLENKYGRAIASQSALRILLKQESTSIELVADAFGLSEYERGYLRKAGVGDALIIADENHVAVHVVAAEEEDPIITTDPKAIKSTKKKK